MKYFFKKRKLTLVWSPLAILFSNHSGNQPSGSIVSSNYYGRCFSNLKFYWSSGLLVLCLCVNGQVRNEIKSSSSAIGQAQATKGQSTLVRNGFIDGLNQLIGATPDQVASFLNKPTNQQQINELTADDIAVANRLLTNVERHITKGTVFRTDESFSAMPENEKQVLRSSLLERLSLLKQQLNQAAGQIEASRIESEAKAKAEYERYAQSRNVQHQRAATEQQINAEMVQYRKELITKWVKEEFSHLMMEKPGDNQNQHSISKIAQYKTLKELLVEQSKRETNLPAHDSESKDNTGNSVELNRLIALLDANIKEEEYRLETMTRMKVDDELLKRER